MQNYSSEDLAVLDERFYTESKTSMIINNGITLSFEGVNTVTIYNSRWSQRAFLTPETIGLESLSCLGSC